MIEPEPTEPIESDGRGIRPLWLVGGAAATLIIGVCALISVLALGGIVWLTMQSNDRAEPTQVSAIGGTVQATDAPLASITPNSGVSTPNVPTPLPVVNASPVISTLVNAPVIGTPVLPPDQAVRSYFQFVSQGRYDVTWQMLTDAFKQKFNCCAPNYNYTGYQDWWNSVDTVEFGDVHTVSQTNDRAVVYAELYYHIGGERSSRDSSPYIELVYDPTAGGWRFEDKRATP